MLRLIAHTWNRGDEASEAMVLEHLRWKAGQLAGPDASPLVWTLACSAAATWWDYSWRTMGYAIGRTQHPDVSSIALDRALRRWLAAARTLAQVQKLNIQVQINVSRGPMQVVNNAAPDAGDAG
jgi:hypothetical protein